MNQDVAFYYPGQYWSNADWIKNLILFFDGVAMLVPEYMSDHGSVEDYPIVASLKEHGLFHVVHPEESIGKEDTKELATALAEIIDSGGLDHLTKESSHTGGRSSFGSLSMSRLGYSGDEKERWADWDGNPFTSSSRGHVSVYGKPTADEEGDGGQGDG